VNKACAVNIDLRPIVPQPIGRMHVLQVHRPVLVTGIQTLLLQWTVFRSIGVIYTSCTCPVLMVGYVWATSRICSFTRTWPTPHSLPRNVAVSRSRRSTERKLHVWWFDILQLGYSCLYLLTAYAAVSLHLAKDACILIKVTSSYFPCWIDM
jgi:hypothetical protein